jgi:hypothetical protein
MFICRSCKKAKQLLLLKWVHQIFSNISVNLGFKIMGTSQAWQVLNLLSLTSLVNVNKLGCCIYKKDILINKTIYSINPCNTRQTYQTCQKSINKLFKLARWLIPNFAILTKLVLAKLCFLSDNSKLIKFDW